MIKYLQEEVEASPTKTSVSGSNQDYVQLLSQEKIQSWGVVKVSPPQEIQSFGGSQG